MWNVIMRYLLMGLLIILASSCNREEDTIVIITVVDVLNDPVSEAEVRLFANPSVPLGDPTRLDMTMTTDMMGLARFDYTEFYEQGQSGFAVLDIMATKDTLLGEDIIRILEEEVNEMTIVIE